MFMEGMPHWGDKRLSQSFLYYVFGWRDKNGTVRANPFFRVFDLGHVGWYDPWKEIFSLDPGQFHT